MLANAKIILADGTVKFGYFHNVEEMIEWMKSNYGKYRAVETDFLNPRTLDERKSSLCMITQI